MKDGEECPWSNIKDPEIRNRMGWLKRPDGACRVINFPESPYPSSVTSWRDKKTWRSNNKEAWSKYREERKNAAKSAEYYEPYNKEKCDELKGRNTTYVRVAMRIVRMNEQKYCPLSYSDNDDSEDSQDES